MKALLVNPLTVETNAIHSTRSLGLWYIAALIAIFT
jgi:hypothetical protein